MYLTGQRKMKTQILKNNLIILTAIATLSLLGVGEVRADERAIEKQIINYVNQERVKQGLEQLIENEVLNKVAELKAQDMLGNDYFAHTSPEGVDPWFWFNKVGYPYRFAGENLGMDFKTATAVHEAWMKSEAHKDNILSNKYKEIGVAVKNGIIDDKETQIAVQVFGSSLRESEIPVGNTQSISEEEVLKKSEIEISQSSLHFWRGEKEDELLISAEVQGEPEAVLVVFGKKEYALEKLRDNVYVNLISLDGINLEESVLIKALGENDQLVFNKVPDKYLAEYLLEKDGDQKEDNENQIVAMLSSEQNNNQLVDQVRTWLNQTGLMLLIIGLLVITILNIWILEREEERLLELKKV